MTTLKALILPFSIFPSNVYTITFKTKNLVITLKTKFGNIFRKPQSKMRLLIEDLTVR